VTGSPRWSSRRTITPTPGDILAEARSEQQHLSSVVCTEWVTIVSTEIFNDSLSGLDMRRAAAIDLCASHLRERGLAWVLATLDTTTGRFQIGSLHFSRRRSDVVRLSCRSKERDVCRAWKEDGRLIVNGDFRLEDENRAASKSELRPSQVLLDAGMRPYMIYLFGQDGAFSKILVPMNSSSKMP
jgi:hypothetical protein